MYSNKKNLLLVALFSGVVVCTYLKAAVTTNAVQNAVQTSELTAAAGKFAAAKSIDDWKVAVANFNALVNKAVSPADKANLLTMFDTGANNIYSALSKNSLLSTNQSAYDAIVGSDASSAMTNMANKFGTIYSPKLLPAGSSSFRLKFKKP